MPLVAHKTASAREVAKRSNRPLNDPAPHVRQETARSLARVSWFQRTLAGIVPPPTTAEWQAPPVAGTTERGDGGLLQETGFAGELPRSGGRPDRTKRFIDVVGASTGIVLLMPLFAVIAIAIKANSQGPVFFRQTRHGANGTLIEVLKFRSMYVDQCDQTGVRQTTRDDPRVTAVGDFLRKSNFDELPQLLNVLRGDMSLVGPRPHVPGMLAADIPYEEFDPRYMSRHRIRPGLTGLAQVNGYRGETRDYHAAKMRLEYDLLYIKRRTLGLDLKIMAQTVVREFLLGRGY
jgi:lipopolysaccharide/colanic/teichoic acid biosynthesis glycosyltransferase